MGSNSQTHCAEIIHSYFFRSSSETKCSTGNSKCIWEEGGDYHTTTRYHILIKCRIYIFNTLLGSYTDHITKQGYSKSGLRENSSPAVARSIPEIFPHLEEAIAFLHGLIFYFNMNTTWHCPLNPSKWCTSPAMTLLDLQENTREAGTLWDFLENLSYGFVFLPPPPPSLSVCVHVWLLTVHCCILSHILGQLLILML